MRISLYIITISFLIGCGADSGTDHPKSEMLPLYNNTDHVVDTSRVFSTSSTSTDLFSSPARTIGSFEGSGAELFGRVEDVVVGPSDNLLVLDSENVEVRIFSNDGEYIDSFGRKGQGPGEFQAPVALSFSESGWLTIADRTRRVQVYEASGETYERTGGFTVEFVPDDACILGDEIYLHGFSSNHPEQSIHVYSRDGDRLRSLGPVYQSENSYVRRGLSDGNIACARSTSRISFAFAYSPLIYGYDPDGKLQWVSRIEPFDGVPVEQTGRTSLQYKWATPGGDLIQNLSDLPGPGIAVQREHVGVDVRGEWYSYWISAQDGTGGYIGESITGPILFADQKRLLAGPEVPFPKVDIYSAEETMWKEVGQPIE